MKKLMFSLILSVATVGSAFAGPSATATATPPAADTVVPVCDGTVAGGGSKPIYGGTGNVFDPATVTPVFVQAGFTAQCSNNTTVSFREPDAVSAVVLGVSVKGNQVFGGSTAGGGVRTIAKCAAAACVASDLSTANWTTAATVASGS